MTEPFTSFGPWHTTVGPPWLSQVHEVRTAQARLVAAQDELTKQHYGDAATLVEEARDALERFEAESVVRKIDLTGGPQVVRDPVDITDMSASGETSDAYIEVTDDETWRQVVELRERAARQAEESRRAEQRPRKGWRRLLGV